MIAYIDLPLRGTNTTTGHDVLVVGLFVPLHAAGGSLTPKVVYVADDGSMGEAEIGEININWRFNDKTRKWMDVDTGEELGGDGD